MCDSEDYIKIRLENQITWYDSKSKSAKFCSRLLKILILILSTAIPLISGFQVIEESELRIVVGFLGALIAVFTGLISILKLQENWINYRTTCETLKHHKFHYEAKADPYNNGKELQLLVKNCESIISRENSDWNEYILKEDN